MRRVLTALCLVFVGLVVASKASAGDLELSLRSRARVADGINRWHATSKQAKWDPMKTAIVVCDMWDKHWCDNATRRVGEMAPRMNNVISKAREQGVFIIHCPSDTLDFYKDWPQRKLAQNAPKVKTKIPLQGWCHLDKTVEGDALPIDDSDGGCDCDPPVKSYRAWSRQHPAIEIAANDAITDSAEAFYLMKQRGISNVIVMGVHTNMCVLGRPFSIRQMVQQGQNVVLMRDMTDSMYNPAKPPFVSHFTGTELVVEHIEKYWCPTVLSSDILGDQEFRFANDHRKTLVVLCAEREYKTEESLPPFALSDLGHDFRVHFVWADSEDKNRLPGIDVLQNADALLVSVRRRTLPPEQLKLVREFVAAGKPVVGIRTANHAFTLRNKPAPEGYDAWPTFDGDVFGGSYTNHYGNDAAVTLTAGPGLKTSGLKVDVEGLKTFGSLYKVSPIAAESQPLLLGSVEGHPAEPVAWFFKRKDGGQSFYTSLGHADDFAQPKFRQFLKAVLLKMTTEAAK